MLAGDLCPGRPPTRGRRVFPCKGISKLLAKQLPVAGLCYAEAAPLSQRFQVGGIRGESMISGLGNGPKLQGDRWVLWFKGDAHQWGAVELLW